MEFNIIFIPGGAVSPEVSQSVVDAYSKKINRKIDLISYPEYEDKNFNINLENEVNYFRNVVGQKYDNKPICVIGFSMGAYFALDLAAQKNLNIQKVILISPFLKRPKNGFDMIAKRIKSFFQEQGAHEGIMAYGLTEAIKDLLNYKAQTIGQFRNVILKMKLTNELAGSESQKLILIGNQDIVLPKYSPDELNMKNTKVIYIEGAHDILTNHSSNIAPLIKEFLIQQ